MPRKPAATTGSSHTCPMCNGTSPHVGGPVLRGSPNVFIGGKPAARMGDYCACSGPPDKIATGSSRVFVNGMPIAVVGDKTAHGGVITSGEPTVTIGTRTTEVKSILPTRALAVDKVGVVDKLKAAYAGQTANLKQAKLNQEELLKQAIDLHEVKPEADEEKPLPKFQGEIVFVNGYLSDPLKNPGSHINALVGRNPDLPSRFTWQGENTNEYNRVSQDDYDTADEKAKRDAGGIIEGAKKSYRRLKKPIGFSRDGKYFGYWNQKANNRDSTNKYARYFNAEGHVHYINGSHGLGSNGAHRIDHGIALGYKLATEVYDILGKALVDAQKGREPEIESKTPKYKPVTIVGHSQGACMAAGAALGFIHFAAEKGYSEIPINLILLGVHQPQGLSGRLYDDF